MKKTITLLLTVLLSNLIVAQSFGQQQQRAEFQKYNPAYHFYPSGDPTGLFFYSGKYYNNWGTASSTDFVHWRYADELINRNRRLELLRQANLKASQRDSIRRLDSILRRKTRLGGSGSIVVDWKNTSGFGKDGKPALISFWHNEAAPWNNQVIGLAYSNDTAKTWTRYDKYPVLDINSREFRDPKVFWYEPSQKWIMVIGWAEAPKVKFFSSTNLKDWKFMSDFGPWGATNGVWECADFFPLPVDGNPSKIKWVLSISVQPQNAQYFIGDFDGERFTLDPSFLKGLSSNTYRPEGKVLFDFEHGIDDWKMTGNAFLESPSNQALDHQGAIMGQQGRFFINSFHDRGQGTGDITSPAFKITSKYLNFLVGGNHDPANENINLWIDGKIVRTETGNNSGGLSWRNWNVSPFIGKTAKIQITDNSKNAAIYIDHIIASDKPANMDRQKAFWLDYGADFFAVRAWNSYADNESRKIWTAWMGSWRYGGTEPVRGIQTIPREVTLKTFPDGIRLVQNPIKELQSLRDNHNQVGQKVVNGSWILSNIKPSKNSYEIEVEFENQTAESFGLKLAVGGIQKTIVGYSVKNGELSIDRRNSGLDKFTGLFKEISKGPLKISKGNLKLHIFVDNCSIEVFGNDGEISLSSKIYPDPSSVGIELFSTKGAVKVKSFNIWELKAVNFQN